MSNWPELHIATWRDTCATLLLYSQVIGKIRLALTPRMNEWWNVPLYVTTRGLTTSPMPYGDRTLSIDFDLVDHRLLLTDSRGEIRTLPLFARSVSDFYNAVFAELAAIDVDVTINTAPQESPITTHFPDDHEHAAYDAAAVRRFFDVLSRVEPVFQQFRARFRGKCSPVHFFWGSFDLAVSRFSGRRAPPREGFIERIAYDEEVSSLGFWPGDPWKGTTDALFYSYTVPEPPRFSSQRFRPDAASYSETLRECVLSYEAVRRSPDPEKAILDFAQSTYDAGAKLGKWDRGALAYP